MIDQARALLKEKFGYDDFRPLQQEVIESSLARSDVLLIMPTGGGKSLCYQIPAMLRPGLTVVVSPLISLMQDQVNQLTEAGVPAVFLNSSLTPEAYARNAREVREGRARLLYAAPEALFSPRMLPLLDNVKIDCLAVDEAHCISEWGHDFRPEYRQLAEFRKRFPDIVCMALTATATPRVRQDIRTMLGFDGHAREFLASFDRKNLFLEVKEKQQPFVQLLNFLEKFPNESGIIYCLSRKQVDDLTAVLQRRGYNARAYHAGLSDDERRTSQEMFIRDDVPIMVATVAFGMGIDKPNIRFVVHFDLPRNIEGYYQEIGRAGRDNLDAHCLMLLGYGDIRKVKYFISQKSETEQRVATLHLKALLGFAETEVCRRKPLLAYFGEDYPGENCGMCDNCRSDDRDVIDATVAAQKFLSCVKRTGEKFGTAHIIDVLRGSQSQKVFKFGHEKLSTYDIGKEYSKDEWFRLARQFLHQGLLNQDMEFGGLAVTAKGWEVMRGNLEVRARLDQKAATPGPAAPESTEYDQELFDLLRRERKKLADAADIPPYVIFPDKTLMEMASRFPQTEGQLIGIHGVGAAKLKKYGQDFLDLITTYCHEHGIEATIPAVDPDFMVSSGREPRYRVIGNAFNDGKSVAGLMAEYSVKQQTILDHLFKFIAEGNTLRSEGLEPLIAELPPGTVDAVVAAFDAHGTDFLGPIFEALDHSVDYETLKLLRLHYLSLRN